MARGMRSASQAKWEAGENTSFAPWQSSTGTRMCAVMEQSSWYRNRAVRAHRASVRWSALTAVLTLLALTAAVLRAAGVIGGWDLAGLLSAAAAAGVAWQQVRRHGPLTYAHSLIEQDLETSRIAMSTTVTEDGWAEAVAEAERLVSPSHTEWLVRFGG